MFAKINKPTVDSPNVVKLITFWMLIDYCLIVILAAYYFKQYFAFKGKNIPQSKKKIEEKFHYFLDRCSKDAKDLEHNKCSV